MSDARSLLRAAASQREQPPAVGIHDRWASYNAKTGTLRCSACNSAVIKHERLWGAHAASKTHRANVHAIEAREARDTAKEGAVPEDVPVDADPEPEAEGLKRKEAEDSEETESKRTRRDAPEAQAPAVDKEWEEFQRTVLQTAATAPAPAPQKNYEHATISVEPELHHEQAQGTGEVVEETEEEKRARLDREAREEILSRIEDEQRAQDEADERYVAFLT